MTKGQSELEINLNNSIDKREWNTAITLAGQLHEDTLFTTFDNPLHHLIKQVKNNIKQSGRKYYSSSDWIKQRELSLILLKNKALNEDFTVMSKNNTRSLLVFVIISARGGDSATVNSYRYPVNGTDTRIN